MSRHHRLYLTLSTALATSLAGAAHAELVYLRLLPAPGLEPNGHADSVKVSSQGRTVVFSTSAENWGNGESYTGDRVVAVDVHTGVVDIVSRDPNNGTIFRGEQPAVSGDGRYVAFLTLSHAMGPSWQVLRKDRLSGALDLVSSNAAGQAALNGTDDDTVSISADGRYVAFETGAANFGLPQGSWPEVFVKDMVTGTVKMATVKGDGTPSGGYCSMEANSLSDDGRFVIFQCTNEVLVGAGWGQVYVRDLVTNTTEVVSRRTGANGASTTAAAGRPAISRNGRFVSFQSRGYGGLGHANGVDITGNSGVYLRDRVTHVTTSIPRPAIMPADDYDSCNVSAVSDLGTVILTCLMELPGSLGQVSQVFEYTPGQPSPELISHNPSHQPGNGQSGYSMGVNASGLSIVWESTASDLIQGDTNGFSDIYMLVDSSLLSDEIFANGFQH